MAVRICTIVKKKDDIDIDIKINFELINRIFKECFLFNIKNDLSFYKVLYNKKKKMKILIIKKIIDFFYKFFEHKVYGRKYKLRFKSEKTEGIKVKKKQKKKKFKFNFRKFFKRRRFKRKLLNMLERQKIAQESRIRRYIKRSYADRLPETRNLLHYEKLELPSVMEFENFGINPYRKKKRKFLEEGRFYKYFKNICFKFIRKLKPILIENFNSKKEYVNLDKFHKDIYYYCLAKDFNIKKKKTFLIDEFDLEIESDVNLSNKVDIIKFYSGLTVKFILSRRNCFFQIWNNKGFTLMRITAGFFSRYYKKIYRKMRQFKAFYRFFEYYYGYILGVYKKDIFRQFTKYRKKIAKNLKKLLIKKSDKSKKKSKNWKLNKLRYNGISYLFYYRRHLTLNVIIKMKKLFYSSDSTFNIRWALLFKKFVEKYFYYRNTKRRTVKDLLLTLGVKLKRKKPKVFFKKKAAKTRIKRKYKKFKLKKFMTHRFLFLSRVRLKKYFKKFQLSKRSKKSRNNLNLQRFFRKKRLPNFGRHLQNLLFYHLHKYKFQFNSAKNIVRKGCKFPIGVWYKTK